MAEASYARQFLATHAAGYINGAGTTQVAFGCSMTRLATGHYALLLDANAGIVNEESYTQVQVKGTAFRLWSVEDQSNREKRIHVVDSSASDADSDIEVKLFKSVTRR